MERLRKRVVSMSKKTSSLGKTVRGGIVYLIDRYAFLAFLDARLSLVDEGRTRRVP